MSMRIDLGAKVRTRDGEDAGTLERAVIDPQSKIVREFVVDTGGFLGRLVLVPAAKLESAVRDGDVLLLDLGKKEFERLPEYVPEGYAAPPSWWVPPVGLGFPGGAYLWPTALIDTVPPPPVEAPRTTAAPASGAETARPDRMDVSLARGTVVLDRNGEDVGVVDEVRLSPSTDGVEGFVLRVGGTLRTLFGGGDVVEVSRSQIDSIDESLVRLRISKDELQRLVRGTAGGSSA